MLALIFIVKLKENSSSDNI